MSRQEKPGEYVARAECALRWVNRRLERSRVSVPGSDYILNLAIMAFDWQAALAPTKATTDTFIGVVVAVCGNVLISFALNCQKLAHRRIETAYNKEHGLDDAEELGSYGATDPALQVIVSSPVDVIPSPRRTQSLPIASPGSRSPALLPRQAVPFVVQESPAGSVDSRPGHRTRTHSTVRSHSPILEARENSNSNSTSREEPAVDGDLEAAAEPKAAAGVEESAYLHSKLWYVFPLTWW